MPWHSPELSTGSSIRPGDCRPRASLLLAHRTGDFQRRDILHRLAAALQVDVWWIAFAFLSDLHFKLAFFAAKHVAGGGFIGIGIAHVGLPWEKLIRKYSPAGVAYRLRVILHSSCRGQLQRSAKFNFAQLFARAYTFECESHLGPTETGKQTIKLVRWAPTVKLRAVKRSREIVEMAVEVPWLASGVARPNP